MWDFLIPYLQDNQKAADYLRQVCWPDGVKCPCCGSDAVEPRERCDNGLQRFNGVPCARRWGQQFAMFTDWTGSIFEESKLRPREWLLGRVDEFEVLPTKSTTYGKIGVSINSSKINGLVLIRQHALVIGLWQLKLNATAQAKIIVAGLPEVLAQRLGMGR
jgi:hypothetical protein